MAPRSLDPRWLQKNPACAGPSRREETRPERTQGQVRIPKYPLAATASCAFLSTVTLRLQRANQVRFGASARKLARRYGGDDCPNGCTEGRSGVVRSPALWLNCSINA